MDGDLYPRAISSVLQDALGDTPVVCLQGPRQSGKTTLVRSAFPDRPYVSLDEHNLFSAASLDPLGFVENLPPVVTLDEIQRVPELLPAIKLCVDRDRNPGRFLLTGSANLLLLPTVSESLAGRMEVVHLQPLTEAEKDRMPGVFLRDFLQGRLKPEICGQAAQSRPGFLERVLAGGYPEPLTRSPVRARQWHRQYLKAIVERDIKDVARIRNGAEVARLLELLCLRTAGLLNISGLAQDLSLHRETVVQYVLLLERLFLVRRLAPWHRNGARRLIKTPKVHLVDSGLAATLTGVDEPDWLERRELMGHLLESFVVHQMITQACWTDPDLRFWHYRDKDKVEVDLVITRGKQTWGVEVKASSTLKSGDTAGLRRLAAQCGDDFQGGILVYTGTNALPLADGQFLAVPIHSLWDR